MSKRDDMKAALECREPAGAVPIWEIEFQAWDKFSGRHVILGKEFENLTSTQQEKALYENAEILLNVADEFHYAALSVPNNYWEQAPGILAYYILPAEARYRQLQVLRELAPADLMLIAGSGGVIGIPSSENYVEFSYLLFDAPEEIDVMVQNVLNYGISEARRLQDCGADAVFTASDIGDNSGLFYNPEQMQRYIYPALHTWSHAVREMGLYAIMHSDGQLTRALQDIATSGLHALQAIDPVAGMSMRAAKDSVAGKLCLCGNIDCGLLLTATPDKVYAETSELLQQCKTGGGLVLGASNAVQPDVPVENYQAMIAAWKDYGRYDSD